MRQCPKFALNEKQRILAFRHELPMMSTPGVKNEPGQLAKELGVAARALDEREHDWSRRIANCLTFLDEFR
jgi:hypothetical protein